MTHACITYMSLTDSFPSFSLPINSFNSAIAMLHIYVSVSVYIYVAVMYTVST